MCIRDRAYSNLAVLGDHSAHGRDGEVDGELLGHAIDLLESVRLQGENDPYWNSRMGYSCLMAYRSAATAYEYAKHWLALAPDDPDAQKLVRDCEEDVYKRQRQWRHCWSWSGIPGPGARASMWTRPATVSYTHLDVYKRQALR